LRTLSLSSEEEKYKEDKEVAKEAVWLRHVLIELVLVQKLAIEFRCEKHSAIHIVYNRVYHSKTKHINLDTLFEILFPIMLII